MQQTNMTSRSGVTFRYSRALVVVPAVLYGVYAAGVVWIWREQPAIAMSIAGIPALLVVPLIVWTILKVGDVISVDAVELYRSVWGRRERVRWMDVQEVELNRSQVVVRSAASTAISVATNHPAYLIVRECVLTFLRPLCLKDLRTIYHLDPFLNVLFGAFTLVFLYGGVSSILIGGAMLMPGVLGFVLAALLGVAWPFIPQRYAFRDGRFWIESWRKRQPLTVDDVRSIALVNGHLAGLMSVRLVTKSDSYDLQHIREGELRLYLSLVEWYRAARHVDPDPSVGQWLLKRDPAAQDRALQPVSDRSGRDD